MVIGFRSLASNPTDWNAKRTSVTVAKPTGAVVGDLIYATVWLFNDASSAPSFTSPSGWTVSQVTFSAPDPWANRLVVMTKPYAGEASWTFSHGTGWSGAHAIAFTGVDLTTPLDAATVSNTKSNYGGSFPAATVTGPTTVTDGAWLVSSRQGWDGLETSPSSGWTERWDDGDRIDTQVRPTAGPTGTLSIPHGNSSNGNPWGLIVVALRPAPASTTHQVSGSATSTTQASGNVTRIRGLSAVAASVTAALGAASLISGVSGDATSFTNASGQSNSTQTLSSNVSSSTSAEGSVSVARAVTGESTSDTSGNGSVTLLPGPKTYLVSGEASSTTDATGDATSTQVVGGVGTSLTSSNGGAHLLRAVSGGATSVTSGAGSVDLLVGPKVHLVSGVGTSDTSANAGVVSWLFVSAETESETSATGSVKLIPGVETLPVSGEATSDTSARGSVEVAPPAIIQVSGESTSTTDGFGRVYSVSRVSSGSVSETNGYGDARQITRVSGEETSYTSASLAVRVVIFHPVSGSGTSYTSAEGNAQLRTEPLPVAPDLRTLVVGEDNRVYIIETDDRTL